MSLASQKERGVQGCGTQTGRAFTPRQTVNYETLVNTGYMVQCKGFRFPDDAMLDLRILAYYSIPKSGSKKLKAQKLANIIRPTKKPDMDGMWLRSLPMLSIR